MTIEPRFCEGDPDEKLAVRVLDREAIISPDPRPLDGERLLRIETQFGMWDVSVGDILKVINEADDRSAHRRRIELACETLDGLVRDHEVAEFRFRGVSVRDLPADRVEKLAVLLARRLEQCGGLHGLV